VFKDDSPGSLAYPDVLQRRHKMQVESHIRPLVDYVRGLSTRGAGYVPEFDPLDGGVETKLLFLMEKPGPKTCPSRGGSGFVSRNNNDPTAKATHKFMAEAKIPRRDTAMWNVIPWWNGTIRLTAAEKSAGAREIRPLLKLFPVLKGVVLVGNAAAKLAEPQLSGLDLKIFYSVHPSIQARNGPHSKERWPKLGATWREAWDAIA
jgi:hypothetical protein